MKKVIFLMFLIFSYVSAVACQLSFEVVDRKDVYQLNDVVTIRIVLALDHRNCDVKPSETLFKTTNMEVIESGEWRQTGSRTFEREFKVKITASEGHAVLAAKRECHKDGASGSVSLRISS